jgi:hypothetical protein
MRTAEGLLPKKDDVARTKTVQDEIVKDLEELIRQLQKQQKQSSSQSNSSSRQQASRSKIPQPGQQPSRSKPGDRESKEPAEDSEERQGAPKKADVDLAQLEEVIKEIWGHLPERERERLRQLFREEEPISNHELAIEKYFRRMSEAEEN